jgi:hypothetical protein
VDELVDYLNDRTAEVARMIGPLRNSIVAVANHLIAHPNEQVPGATLIALVTDHASQGAGGN